MRSLEIEFLERQAIPVVVTGQLRKLGQYQGKQELLFHRRPKLLKNLREIAIIQSAESSNRIEGIVVPSKRIHEILKHDVQPKNRPEAQVLGYRNVLSHVHTHFKDIEISPKSILEMHREMLKFTDLPRGSWKTTDNVIEEKLPSGQWITRFIPTTARKIPYYMEVLCERFHRLWKQQDIDQLLVVFAFIFDFLCIHPFTDGNGRISRLLTILLLHKIGFDITRYISHEKLIEDTKESYYNVLHQCSQRWVEGKHILSPWLEFQIGLLIAAYHELEDRISIVDTGKGEKTAWVLEVIDQLSNEFTIGDLIKLCPDVSRPMVRHILEELRKKEKLELIGLGRNAKWKKKH